MFLRCLFCLCFVFIWYQFVTLQKKKAEVQTTFQRFSCELHAELGVLLLRNNNKMGVLSSKKHLEILHICFPTTTSKKKKTKNTENSWKKEEKIIIIIEVKDSYWRCKEPKGLFRHWICHRIHFPFKQDFCFCAQ